MSTVDRWTRPRTLVELSVYKYVRLHKHEIRFLSLFRVIIAGYRADGGKIGGKLRRSTQR